MRLRWWVTAWILLFLGVRVVSAHANLLRSDPPANASLDQAPAEIRLWLSEPVEPDYSKITLRDSNGDTVDTPDSVVDPDEAAQMSLQPGPLDDGLYTVVWRAISAADGHPTQGSFAFGIGVATSGSSTAITIDETVPIEGVVIRWLNLLSLSLALGSIAFVIFVWRPVIGAETLVVRPLMHLIHLSWIVLGVTTLLMLLMQMSIAANTSLLGAVTNPGLGDYILNSSYGRLWLLRLGLWLAMGLVLWRLQQRGLLLTLGLGAGILLTQSLFSHASGTTDAVAGIAADWLHLLASNLWLGGLITFFIALRRLAAEAVFLVGRMTAYFSNYARVGVVLLIITGTYAAWLQVGSVEALLNTVFGQALLVKLGLMLPLLLTAGINLLVTQRRLAAGGVIWTRTLRTLLAVEITLVIAIMAAVGVMTSGAPGRGIQAERDALVALPTPDDSSSYFGMEIVNNQMTHLQIIPGYVGENTFYVSPYDVNGSLIDNASLIRLRFDNLDEDLGESELRPTYDPDAQAYTASGSNLSTPGHWRMRVTIQRPGEFDTVVDFETEIQTAPPPPVPEVQTGIDRVSRVIVVSVIGVLLLGASQFFLLLRSERQIGVTLLAGCGVLVGVIFALTAALSFSSSGALVVEDAWARPAAGGTTGAVYFSLHNGTAQDLVLTQAETPVSDTVELHETQIDDNNVARMSAVNELRIPAGETVQVKPGGYHLMLMNLHRDLADGDSFPITLRFASGMEVTRAVTVRTDR